MPRTMPSLADEFRDRVAAAVRLAEIGELARAEALAGSKTRKNLHYSRLELLYELAFLRIFVGWEIFLEQAFLRYLSGYTSTVGGVVLQPGVTFSASLTSAESTMLGGQSYFLWHNPTRVVNKAASFFSSSPVQAVVASNQSRLEQFAAIRHRITHSQTDARKKFDAATMGIAGKRYRGSRAGAFLRDIDPSAGGVTFRWVENLGTELQKLASQIA